MQDQPDPPQFETAARRFMLPFLLLLAVCWLLMALGTLFLSRMGELRPVQEVVIRQHQSGGLYGEALRDNRRAYKLALYRALRPQVVAIGSSRAQEFRADFFRVPFANLGGGILTFDEADSFVDAMLAQGSPKLAIFAVDWWWFDTRREQTSQRMAYDGKPESDVALADRLLPARWLIEKKFRPAAMARAVFTPAPDAFGPPQGALAILNHTGFRPDGSWAWLNIATAAHSDPGQEFVPAPSPPGTAIVDQAQLDHLQRLVHKMQLHGVRVILFIPPEMSQTVRVHRDNADAFPVFPALRRTLATMGAPWFDFNDAARLGSSDCEFIDSVHAGEVLGVRMLKAMAADPALRLNGIIDHGSAEQALARWHGHAVMLSDAEQAQVRERDFLGIGCPK